MSGRIRTGEHAAAKSRFVEFNPLYDGPRPYQQIPFQYSLHRLDAAGEQARHFEHLAGPGEDPRKEIAEKLLGEIPDGACVLVYNLAFENRVLRELGMNGSYSLKSVLPVLVPEMTYEGMVISGGEMASEAYFTMGEISDPAELANLRKSLLDYCRQDTMGLVRLVEKMRTIDSIRTSL